MSILEAVVWHAAACSPESSGRPFWMTNTDYRHLMVWRGVSFVSLLCLGFRVRKHYLLKSIFFSFFTESKNQTESSYLIRVFVPLPPICMFGERWGSIIIGESIEQLSGMQSTSFVIAFPPGALWHRVKLEAAGPSYRSHPSSPSRCV